MSYASSGSSGFKKHHVFEIADNLGEAKQIASDATENERYVYRAKATLQGNCAVEPYDAVYLDGLDGGMNGYWTVLSVTHVFDGGAPYLLEVELGTDQLGLGVGTFPGAAYRDIEAELAEGAVPSVSNSVLTESIVFPQLSKEDLATGATRATSNTNVPINRPPDFSIIEKQTAWRAVNEY